MACGDGPVVGAASPQFAHRRSFTRSAASTKATQRAEFTGWIAEFAAFAVIVLLRFGPLATYLSAFLKELDGFVTFEFFAACEIYRSP
jgi:hypothetical protein